MISEEEARRRVLQSVGSLRERTVPLSKALDCFSTSEVVARLPLPTFDNSAMDGYAVVASSSRKGARLKVIGEQPAGPDRQLRISSGEAVRIFTGAPIPAGADAVVMQEDTTREGDEIVVNVACQSWRIHSAARLRFSSGSENSGARRADSLGDDCPAGVAGFRRCDNRRPSKRSNRLHR